MGSLCTLQKNRDSQKLLGPGSFPRSFERRYFFINPNCLINIFWTIDKSLGHCERLQKNRDGQKLLGPGSFPRSFEGPPGCINYFDIHARPELSRLGSAVQLSSCTVVIVLNYCPNIVKSFANIISEIRIHFINFLCFVSTYNTCIKALGIPNEIRTFISMSNYISIP